MPKEPPARTLCWTCARAHRGCSWSENQMPVEGWRAEPTVLCGGIDSFLVLECPLHVHETRAARRDASGLDQTGCEELVQAIVMTAVRDYLALRTERVAIERFFRSEVFRSLSNAEPEVIIRYLRDEVKRKASMELRDLK